MGIFRQGKMIYGRVLKTAARFSIPELSFLVFWQLVLFHTIQLKNLLAIR
jgi:hypothetical protein